MRYTKEQKRELQKESAVLVLQILNLGAVIVGLAILLR